jgi:hypothetical protein
MSSRVVELNAWLARVTGPDWVWHAKYLAANDTAAKPNVHQGGPYLGKELLRFAFPSLSERANRESNPDLTITVYVASHSLVHDIRVVWYNSKRLTGKPNGRDEARMTQWGGKDHPLLAPASTGSLVLFAFHVPLAAADASTCEVWVTESTDEEDELLSVVGPLEPGGGIVFRPSSGLVAAADRVWPCTFADHELRDEWHATFPSSEDVLEMSLQRLPDSRRLDPDRRLLKRRDCEFALFLAIENHVVLPRVREGFQSVEEFVAYANAVTNRRKARAGKSLELQVRAIFHEEELPHSWSQPTEGKRTPDFVFPSIERYRDRSWPRGQLRMLAAKTTCKDRWRQILNEAAEIPIKHLLTLQEGVSTDQYREMKDEGVRLVVPKGLHEKYPDDVQPELLTLAGFIAEAKALG